MKPLRPRGRLALQDGCRRNDEGVTLEHGGDLGPRLAMVNPQVGRTGKVPQNASAPWRPYNPSELRSEEYGQRWPRVSARRLELQPVVGGASSDASSGARSLKAAVYSFVKCILGRSLWCASSFLSALH
jgi:hypothetical protein